VIKILRKRLLDKTNERFFATKKCSKQRRGLGETSAEKDKDEMTQLTQQRISPTMIGKAKGQACFSQRKKR